MQVNLHMNRDAKETKIGFIDFKPLAYHQLAPLHRPQFDNLYLLLNYKHKTRRGLNLEQEKESPTTLMQIETLLELQQI